MKMLLKMSKQALKILKWALAVLFILGGIGFISEGSIVSGILMISIALPILLPKSHSGDKFYDKIAFRIILSVGLFIVSAIAYQPTEKKIENQNSLTLESSSITEAVTNVSKIPTEPTTERITEIISETPTEPPIEKSDESETFQEIPIEENVYENEPVVEEDIEEEPEYVPVEEEENPNAKIVVYITPTGKKYHYDGSCNGGTYYESTLDRALSIGLKPCKKCAN